MNSSTGFVDYYEFLGVVPTASRTEIAERIRQMYKQWHPDVCRDPRAHEVTVIIGTAKEFLLDESRRREYDLFRDAYYRKETQAQGYEEWQYEQEEKEWQYQQKWEDEYVHVRQKAEHSANLGLEDILSGIFGIATYAWEGTDRFRGKEPDLSFWQKFWCGIGGWACLICLIVPGTSIITFFVFYWAFFPGPTNKFVGCGTVYEGMILALIVSAIFSVVVGVPLILLLISAFS